jgi:hypothetical protein
MARHGIYRARVFQFPPNSFAAKADVVVLAHPQ